MSELQSQKKRRPLGLSYLIDENPPWHVCLLLGFQVRQANLVLVFLPRFRLDSSCLYSHPHLCCFFLNLFYWVFVAVRTSAWVCGMSIRDMKVQLPIIFLAKTWFKQVGELGPRERVSEGSCSKRKKKNPSITLSRTWTGLIIWYLVTLQLYSAFSPRSSLYLLDLKESCYRESCYS